MADEQYAWLDKEAAEKLLRGEPVDPADGRPCQDAERLAAALGDAARTALPATAELPGEAAALAAFRAAPRRAAAPAPSAHGEGEGPETAVLAPVHIGRAASGTGGGAADPRGDRTFRWSRPLRFGLVASLACCAIGGVAVAAGSGMLPAPFGRHTPSPATSVSAAASPEELGADVMPDEETSAPPPPGTPSPDAPPPGGDPGTGKDDDDTARPGAGAPQGGRGGRSDGPTGTHPTGGSRSGDGTGSGGTGSDEGGGAADPGKGTGGSGDNDGSGAGTWYAKTLKACRDYRDGKLDDDRRTRLENLAKGARNLDRFCDRLLDGKGGQGDGRGGQGDGWSGDPGDGADDKGGDASGPLPSIRFSESPGPSTAALAPAPQPSGSAVADDPWSTAAVAAR
ncbi:hypothetical protein K388_00804 [Streptomyces sp. KhCrAH-43]|uniref:hypothetical protein n=1 Tax=unclassified Streptomyces TaxID=2593676 RepID=UPI0003728287|nr:MULTISPECIES: hypothetical protein [unclassified Streptomyces]MYS38376.1 hypothetical protein [Streptomyces sp. SID4920]MYX66568.1 hypothetical protein [Streptomyces sp. SID8373]RAJ68061.1 hypothetical protein K388_00804 [Streptomyces sp. KhCrAH-43]